MDTSFCHDRGFRPDDLVLCTSLKWRWRNCLPVTPGKHRACIHIHRPIGICTGIHKLLLIGNHVDMKLHKIRLLALTSDEYREHTELYTPNPFQEHAELHTPNPFQENTELHTPNPSREWTGLHPSLVEGEERAGKWTVLAIVAIGVFMATLDTSIVNISLPAMARSFGVSLSGAIEWVIIAYLVVTAAILLTAGRLADMVGRKVVWCSGLVIFTVGSVLCGAAPS